jgi:hypothetical protein
LNGGWQKPLGVAGVGEPGKTGQHDGGVKSGCYGACAFDGRGIDQTMFNPRHQSDRTEKNKDEQV